MYLYIHTYIYAHVNEVYKHSHQAARYPLIIVDHHWSRWNPLTVTNLSWQRSWGTEWQRANQQYQYRELPRPCRSESGPDSPSSPTIVAVAVEIFWTPNWDQFWTTGKREICFVLCGKLGLGTRKPWSLSLAETHLLAADRKAVDLQRKRRRRFRHPLPANPQRS